MLILLVPSNSLLDRNGNQIGIATELQERCDRSDPLLDITPQQQASVGCHRPGRQQPGLHQIGRRRQPLGQESDRNTSCTGVTGVDVDFTLRVVKFVDQGRSHGIGRGQHAEIQRCPVHRDNPLNILPADAKPCIAFDAGGRAQIADEIGRKVIRTGCIHRAEGESVAMGEDEMAVQPGPGASGQFGLLQLPGRENHLLSGVAIGE